MPIDNYQQGQVHSSSSEHVLRRMSVGIWKIGVLALMEEKFDLITNKPWNDKSFRRKLCYLSAGVPFNFRVRSTYFIQYISFCRSARQELNSDGIENRK